MWLQSSRSWSSLQVQIIVLNASSLTSLIFYCLYTTFSPSVSLSEVSWCSKHSRSACCLLWLYMSGPPAVNLYNQVPFLSSNLGWRMVPSEQLEDPPLRGSVRNRIWVNTWCPPPARLLLCDRLDWLIPKLKRKCANLQPDPGEGRSQEQAFGPFTNRIHHQSWTRAHLE